VDVRIFSVFLNHTLQRSGNVRSVSALQEISFQAEMGLWNLSSAPRIA